MCGIAGLVTDQSTVLDTTLLQTLSRTLSHRGPDDHGFLGWSASSPAQQTRHARCINKAWVSLVHRRLSIIDLSPAGWQPMGTPDGRYYIVFNGEIYNYLELRAELHSAGYTFHSHSDTEVLLTAYAHWGCQALTRLIGMFALAILDTQAQTLVLARDYFGIKPLYYTFWRHGFAFASEIKALLTLPGVSRQVHAQRLYTYLRFGLTDHGNDTLLQSIAQVPAAHYLTVPLSSPAEAQLVRYWDIDRQQRHDMSFAMAAEQLRALFLESVRLHLRSDVPVGAALSGGMDSSALVMAMRHLQGGSLPLHTFSYIAEQESMNEESWVDLVSQAAQTQSHKVRLSATDLVTDLQTLLDTQDEPFASTSIYAQMRIFRQAREVGVKVMLDGQGADELFGGYRPAMAARLASLIRQKQWRQAWRYLHCLADWPGAGRLSMLVRALAVLSWQRRDGLVAGLLTPYLCPSWLNRAWLRTHGVVPQPIWQARETDVLREHLIQALVDNSLPMLLRYEDRNAMAFSIESRTPFLTPALVNFVFALPEEYMIAADGTSKAVFRQAMRGIVPDAILDRRDKIGFATPEQEWLLALRPWAEALFASDTARYIPALNLPQVQRQWQAIVARRQPFDFRVWRWLNLICWVQRFDVQFAT